MRKIVCVVCLDVLATFHPDTQVGASRVGEKVSLLRIGMEGSGGEGLGNE